jgi:NitT/TauT family transport system substrate-binding protein
MRITLIENFRAVFYAPFYLPFAFGAYEKEGLQVDLKTSPNAAQTASSLMAGAGDVSWGGPLRLMMALEKNPKAALAFCEVVGHDPFFLVGREPHPGFRPEHLKGKKLAFVTEVPTPWMCLRQDLRLAGVDPSTIATIPGRSMGESVAALRSGEADVIQVFQPYAAQVLQEGGGHVWYAQAGRGPVAYTSLNTTRQFAERNPEVLRGMCRAMYRAQKWIASHAAGDMAAALKDFFPDLPREILTACFQMYKDVGLWNRDPILQRRGLEWLRDAALADGILRTKFAYEDCVDTVHAQAVIDERPAPL